MIGRLQEHYFYYFIFGTIWHGLAWIGLVMHIKNKPSQTIPTTELIWGVDVARIFGVSRSELHRRIRSGEIRGIRSVQFLKGNMFSIYDAFSVAHPRADKRTIEELVAKFRQEKVSSRFAVTEKLSVSMGATRKKQSRSRRGIT